MQNTKRWTLRPEGSNWGDFGPDDQLGTLNYLGQTERLAAHQEVKEGQSFSLSLPLTVPHGPVLNPRRKPPVIKPSSKNGTLVFNYPLAHDAPGATDVISDDIVTLSPQYSTQWDALGHVGSLYDAFGDGQVKPMGYNGFQVHSQGVLDPDDFAGAEALSISSVATHGVQGRGVLIDLRFHFGDEFRTISFRDLMHVITTDRIQIRRGDIVCLHTGLADLALSLPANEQDRLKSSCCALDGSDQELLSWISETKIAAIAADNHAVERRNYSLSGESGAMLPLHEHCLFKLGLPLGELWHLTPLAHWLRDHDRHSFLLTAAPIYMPGLVGAPVNPIATV